MLFRSSESSELDSSSKGFCTSLAVFVAGTDWRPFAALERSFFATLDMSKVRAKCWLSLAELERVVAELELFLSSSRAGLNCSKREWYGKREPNSVTLPYST